MSPVKPPIKILECIRQGQVGGGESHLLSLVKHLNKDEFLPVVLSFTDGPMIDQLKGMGIETKVISTTRPFDISKYKAVKKFIKDGNFRLVHAHGTRANSNVLMACKSLKIPVIYTIHGWSFHPGQNYLVSKMRKLGERYLVKNSSKNISVSESNKQTGANHFGNFNSVVIANGIDATKFDPQKKTKDIRAKLGIPSDGIMVLFMARFTYQKQPLVLLQSFLKAVAKNKKLYLVMAGDGEMKNEAIEIVSNSEYKQNIFLLPFTDQAPSMLQAADIFVLPSLWEGLSIALLEAMSMQKAIIATAADGTVEIIEHNKNGILVNQQNLEEELCNAMLLLADDNDLRNKLATAAKQKVHQNFDAGRMTSKIEDVYFEVINENLNELRVHQNIRY